MAETKTPTRRKRSTTAKTETKTAARKKTTTSGTTKPKTTTRANTTTAKTKAPARKGSAKTTKAAPKKATAAKKVYEPHPIEYTDEGFQVGSDSAIIAAALTEGATTRTEVNEIAAERIKKANGLQTRSGKDKYVPSMVSSILSRMLATGEYEIFASWQLVPVEKKTTRRKK